MGCLRVVVAHAGSATEIVHVPTGRRIRRRPTTNRPGPVNQPAATRVAA